MKIIPLNDRVLVRSTVTEEKTASGLFIPQTSQEKTQIAIVEAVGDDEAIKVKVGDKVTTATKVGKMGNTGNSTGTHLHLEASTTQSWQCDSFVNPR